MTDRPAASDGFSDRRPAADTSPSLADEFIDELVPAELDWRTVVTSYPRVSVVLLAAAGFWLGRSRGRAILSGITGLVTDTVNESINEFFGRDLV